MTHQYWWAAALPICQLSPGSAAANYLQLSKLDEWLAFAGCTRDDLGRLAEVLECDVDHLVSVITGGGCAAASQVPAWAMLFEDTSVDPVSVHLRATGERLRRNVRRYWAHLETDGRLIIDGLMASAEAELATVLSRAGFVGDTAHFPVAHWFRERPRTAQQVILIIESARHAAEVLLARWATEAPSWMSEPLTEVWAEPGDVHRGGEPVVFLRSPTQGAVYHPRSLSALDALDKVRQVLQMGGTDLPWSVVRREFRGLWGWTEWRAPVEVPEEVRLAALGSLAAVLHRLGGTGFERDHVVSSAQGVVVTQLDGLLSASLEETESMREIIEVLGANPDDSRVMTAALDTCEQLAAHPSLLQDDGPLARWLDHPMRAFVRNTSAYSKLLSIIDSPPFCHSNSLAQAVLARLGLPLEGHRLPLRFVRAEICDLLRRDLPYLTSSPRSVECRFTDDRVVEDVFASSGLDAARRRLQ